MYPHRGMGGAPPGAASGARLDELLDGVRAEFQSALRQCENYEHQSEWPSCKMATPLPWPFTHPALSGQEMGSNGSISPIPGQRDAACSREGLRHGTEPHDLEAEVLLPPKLPRPQSRGLTTRILADMKKK